MQVQLGDQLTFLVLLTNSGSSRLSNCSSVSRTAAASAVPELSVSLRALRIRSDSRYLSPSRI